jgi:hypothetical protein
MTDDCLALRHDCVIHRGRDIDVGNIRAGISDDLAAIARRDGGAPWAHARAATDGQGGGEETSED